MAHNKKKDTKAPHAETVYKANADYFLRYHILFQTGGSGPDYRHPAAVDNH
jgi:hypothetical protein